ncbi:hypothetical protein [Natrinema sp. HArc-T2]|uniref:hypothetical protein n=1 Tax=Natrinema sp. HArc-T2 TaxID=3242701 RepID=UPI00359E96A2
MTASTTESHAYEELAKPDTNNATYLGWANWDNQDEWPADFYIENKKKFFEHLDRMNQGLQNGYRANRPYQTYRMNRDLVATLADKLGMTTQQRGRAINWFTILDLQTLGLPAQTVAYCVCTYVVHSDESNRECHPQTSEDEFDDLFRDIQAQLGIRQERFESVYGKVAHRIRTKDFEPTIHDKYQLDEALQFQWRTFNAEKDDGWL